MANKHKLICKLNRFVVTAEGDFIPNGTPCEVLRWDKAEEGKIEVRTKAYMYADDLGDDRNGPVPVVNYGLIIAVDPIDLVYKDSFSINVE
jgi:hypothetical protein